jgi:hypothetical protein
LVLTQGLERQIRHMLCKPAYEVECLFRILRAWGADPLQCPCCKGTMKVVAPISAPVKSNPSLACNGRWECDIETFEPIKPP